MGNGRARDGMGGGMHIRTAVWRGRVVWKTDGQQVPDGLMHPLAAVHTRAVAGNEQEWMEQ